MKSDFKAKTSHSSRDVAEVRLPVVLFFLEDCLLRLLACLMLPLEPSAVAAKLLKICSRVVWATEYSLIAY